MQAFIYRRVSTQAQDSAEDPERSLRTQEVDCRAFCAERGYEVVEVFTDRASGRTTDRDGLGEMLARAGQVDRVVVWKYDRLSRDTADRIILEQTVAKAGATIESATEPQLAGDDATSVMTRTILASVSQFESAMIGMRTRAGQRNAAKQGKPPHRPPYGYRLVTTAEREADGDTRWVIVPEQAEVIHLIDELFLSGHGSGAIARRLNAERIPTATGNQEWSDQVVRYIAHRATYSGIYHYGKTEKGSDGKTRRVPRDEWIEAPLTVAPIIRQLDVWRRMDAERERRSTPGRRPTTTRSPYAGLVRCDGCDGPMSIEYWDRKSGERIYALRCDRHNRIANCPRPQRIRESDLTQWIILQVADVEATAKAPERLNPNLDAALATRSKLDEERERMVNVYRLGTLTETEFVDWEAGWQRRSAATDQILDAPTTDTGPEISLATVTHVDGVAFLDGSVPEQGQPWANTEQGLIVWKDRETLRGWARGLIDSITVRDDTLDVVWRVLGSGRDDDVD